jgi:hypothetical protein
MSVASEFSTALGKALDELGSDEWAVVHARDAAIHGLSPSDSFESIVEVLHLAAAQTDKYAFTSCCELAMDLARMANTTEQPQGLVQVLPSVEARAKTHGCYNQFEELCSWFRIAA